MPHNYNSTKNHNKTIRIISVATIALSLTSCLRDPNTLPLKTKTETLEIAIPDNKSNSKSQPSAQLELKT
jgi:hypothetical protein